MYGHVHVASHHGQGKVLRLVRHNQIVPQTTYPDNSVKLLQYMYMYMYMYIE